MSILRKEVFRRRNIMNNMPNNSTVAGNIPTELYRQIHEVLPISCVDILLKNGDSFLLAKRNNKPAQGYWWFPGGRVLKNETLKDAAFRKTQQETGLDIKIEKILGVNETIFPDGPFDSSTHTINVVFLATCTSPENIVTLDDQNDEYQWFSHIHDTWDPHVKKFLELAGFPQSHK